MSFVELYFCCSQVVRRLFLLHKPSEIFRHFLQLYQNKATCCLRLHGCRPFLAADPDLQIRGGGRSQFRPSYWSKNKLWATAPSLAFIGPFPGVYHVVLTLFHRISQTSSKVGQRQLVMKNLQPGDLSQSETEKSFKEQ